MNTASNMTNFTDLSNVTENKSINARAKKIITDPLFLDRTAQICFFFGLGGIAGWGVCIALPYIYSDLEYWSYATRAFGCFLTFQLLVNWACMKFVDSSYNPFKHGTQSDGDSLHNQFKRETQPHRQDIGKHSISEKGNNDEIQTTDATLNANNSGKVRKDARVIPVSNGSETSVAMSTTETYPAKNTAYSYFSWTPCLQCNRPRPPRCHHCPLCDKCVLKRDHHCYFAGACIGYRNLRHFSVFVFWAAVGTVFASFHALVYAYYDVLPFVSYFDFFFPISILRAIFGFIEMKYAVCITLGWILLAYLKWSCTFLDQLIMWIINGVTSFEQTLKMSVHDTRDIHGKLRAVYGNYWILNFIIPLHFVFEPIDDPVNWPSYKA